jgi:anti-sigma-K factor RskA
VAVDRDELEALAAEYVLGTLDADERRAAEARMSADPGFRSAVAAWAERLQPLADTATPAAPPAGAFGRILARIDASPAASTGQTENVVALRRSVRRWQVAAFLAAAAAVVLAVFVAVDRTSPVRTEYVAMLTPDGGTPAFVLTVDTAANTLSIRRVVDAAPASGRSYELWAVEPGAQPVSMGVVDTVSYTRELPYAPDGLVFAISDEPEGGSPTGLVSGQVIFSGPLVPAQ